MAQYGSIGTKYDAMKTTAFNKVEQYNFRRNVQPFLQSPGHQKVLDLACGTGFYSQRLLEWGAGSIVGVDISQPMVDGATVRLSGSEYASRIRFMQGDGLIPTKYGEGPTVSFHVATGAWFLNYAQNLSKKPAAMVLLESLTVRERAPESVTNTAYNRDRCQQS